MRKADLALLVKAGLLKIIDESDGMILADRIRITIFMYLLCVVNPGLKHDSFGSWIDEPTVMYQ